jgi:hypothetical protein
VLFYEVVKLLSIDGTTIQMTRGDTARITLTLNYSDGTPYVPTEGDSISFAVKKKLKDGLDTLINIDIPTDTLLLEIQPQHTSGLAFGEYVYDIQFTGADGTVDTFIYESKFIIRGEVE